MSATSKADRPAVPTDPALRRERFGWYSYDWAMSVFNTSVTTVFLAPYLTSIAEAAADADGRIHPLGISVPTGSWFGYVLSLSVVLQVLVLPITGAIAGAMPKIIDTWLISRCAS